MDPVVLVLSYGAVPALEIVESKISYLKKYRVFFKGPIFVVPVFSRCYSFIYLKFMSNTGELNVFILLV